MHRWPATVLLVLGVCTAQAAPAAAQPAGSPSRALARVLDRGKWSRTDVENARRAFLAGASLRTQGSRGVTTLMFASRSGDLALMRRALRAGVEVNARTPGGLTALWYAMATRDTQKVRLLLDHGARVDHTDSDGRTPLMHATHFKFRGAIELLVARGAKVNARNDKGFTALAYTDAHPGITNLLRQHGAVE